MSNWIKRKKTKVVKVGNVPVGGNNPISIQSMTNTDTCDEVSTINQIKDLEAAGADIVRVSVPGFEEAKAFKKIKNAVNIPLVATNGIFTAFLIFLNAFASSNPGTETLTISAPAASRSLIWFIVETSSQVSVFVID